MLTSNTVSHDESCLLKMELLHLPTFLKLTSVLLLRESCYFNICCHPGAINQSQKSVKINIFLHNIMSILHGVQLIAHGNSGFSKK